MHTRRPIAWLLIGVASTLIGAAGAVEVDPGSYKGRTEAAIREFREAVALEPDLERGARLFGACASCHQADGGGRADGTVPVIAGQHVSVLVKQLVDFRHDRRWNTRMQDSAKAHELSGAQELLDVAAYAESLPRPSPREGRKESGTTTLLGQTVYYRECADCHGRLGEGDLKRMQPRLAGQHYWYLLRQLYDTAAGTRPGMDKAHRKRIGALSDAEMTAIADFLSRLSPDLASKKSAD